MGEPRRWSVTLLAYVVATILKALRASMMAAGCKPKDGLAGEVEWTTNAVETGPVLEEPEAFTHPPESAEV